MSEAQAWDQLEGEPNRWYQRFCAYRLMGPGRTIEAVFLSMVSGGKRPGQSWYNYSKQFSWNDRVNAWDQYLSELKEADFISRQMGANEVRAGLADIARGNLADLMEITTGGYTFKLLIDGPDGTKIVNPKTKLIKKIKQKVTTYLAKQEDGEDREVIESEIELYSAHEAYRDIGKMHALFVDKSEVLNTGDVTVKVIKGVSLDDL